MKTEDHINAIKEQGFTILRDVLSMEQVASVKKALAPWLKKEHMGRNDFEGFASERIYALLAKAPMLALIIDHRDVLAIVDHFLTPNYLLSSNLAINLHPGETEQRFHADHTGVPNCRRTDINGMSTIWAFDDFNDENGATEVVPGSHQWLTEKAITDDAAHRVIMQAGSVVVFHGALFHRGGANHSHTSRLAITPQYCQPWLRQLENMALIMPPESVAQFSPRVQALLGYSIREPGFMGHVDGLHPRRLFDDAYQGRRARGLPS